MSEYTSKGDHSDLELLILIKSPALINPLHLFQRKMVYNLRKFLFTSLDKVNLRNVSTLIGKNLLPRGANSCLGKLTPTEKGGKKVKLIPLKVYVSS